MTAIAVLGASGLLASSGHTVRPGETLSGIAADHGTTVAALAAGNGIADPDLILVGDVLTIPASGSGGAAGTAYTVAPGDTLVGIALGLGISSDQLVAANGLVDGAVFAGQRLRSGPAVDPGPPITCPVHGASFMNDWGFPRSGGRAHTGNDLFAPHGTPVHAPRDGVVTQEVGDIGGNQVRLHAADGISYHVTHLAGFGASGQVGAGEVIGYVGDTGNAIGGPPHAHVEVHVPGVGAVNPYPLLLAAC